ncbi:MAG TPA: serine/threonine-protein kinase [Actinomycetota bacterium]|nr:serine/threonine-protein kinase [Actinomycetota bacterium]
MTTAPGWDFEEGQEIVPERYALRLLGGGHKYEAYLAFDEELQCLVVAKLLRPHLVDDASSLRTLRAEARAVTQLNHPVLHRCFGVVADGPRPHLVLEHLEGPRLSTLLRRQTRLAIEQAIPLGLQLSSALHYMHRQEIVHLDVKPKNVIMSASPRLIDLSVARSFSSARDATDPVGTDAYMAPEQCEPKLLGGMGPAADAWGWGVTMYEATTGVLPFPRVSDGVGPERWPQAHLDPAPVAGDVPPALSELVMTCLEKRPENRPPQSEIAAALEPLSAALPRRRVLSRLRPGIR